MKTLILIACIAFSSAACAQKAYDQLTYKGNWGNFNVVFLYADGYQEASKFISIHKKSGQKMVYTYSKSDHNALYFTNPHNQTSFLIESMSFSENESAPDRITGYIQFGKTTESFELRMVGK